MADNFRYPYSRGLSAAFLKKSASAQRAADVSLEVFDEKGNRFELKFPANVVPIKAKKQLREGIETAVFLTSSERQSWGPLFVGQLGVQLDTNTLYRADSLAVGDWSLVAAGGSTPTYVYDRQAGGGVGIRYYGFLRIDDSRWLIKKLVRTGTVVVETYANVGNNPTYATLDLAWPDRVSLTYDNYEDLIGV